MAWSPISLAVPQYVDSNGTPYSGAVLKAYAAGTSTPISMATDSTGGTTVGSVALNASGYPAVSGNVIIPHVSANYKLALYPTQAAADANSGALWSVDNLAPVGVFATLVNLAASTGAALIGFIQAGAGAVLRTLQAKGRDVVSVKDFGAVGDGVTDDSAAFNAAIAYIKTRSPQQFVVGGGTIFVPAGIYLISEIVIDVFGIMLEGESAGYAAQHEAKGTRLYCTTGDFAVHIKYTTAMSGAHGSGLRNIEVRSTGTDATAVEYGVIVSSSVTLLENVTVGGFKNGIAGFSHDRNKYLRCSIQRNTRCGFSLTNPEEKAYLHPTLEASGELSAFDVAPYTQFPSTDFTMRDCNFESNNVHAVFRDGDVATLDSCIFQNSHLNAVIFYRTLATDQGRGGPHNYRLKDCHFEGNSASINVPVNFANYDIANPEVTVCKTAAGGFLTGTVSGDWASTNNRDTSDAAHDIWIGGNDESVDPGQNATWALSYYKYNADASYLPGNIVLDNCIFVSASGGVLARGAYRLKVRESTFRYGVAGGPTTIGGVRLKTYAYDTIIDKCHSYVEDFQYAAGTRTTVIHHAHRTVGEEAGIIINPGNLGAKGFLLRGQKMQSFTVSLHNTAGAITHLINNGYGQVALYADKINDPNVAYAATPTVDATTAFYRGAGIVSGAINRLAFDCLYGQTATAMFGFAFVRFNSLALAAPNVNCAVTSRDVDGVTMTRLEFILTDPSSGAAWDIETGTHFAGGGELQITFAGYLA